MLISIDKKVESFDVGSQVLLSTSRVRLKRFKCMKVLPKVETPYHDNDLILTPIISSQSGLQ